MINIWDVLREYWGDFDPKILLKIVSLICMAQLPSWTSTPQDNYTQVCTAIIMKISREKPSSSSIEEIYTSKFIYLRNSSVVIPMTVMDSTWDLIRSKFLPNTSGLESSAVLITSFGRFRSSVIYWTIFPNFPLLFWDKIWGNFSMTDLNSWGEEIPNSPSQFLIDSILDAERPTANGHNHIS